MLERGLNNLFGEDGRLWEWRRVGGENLCGEPPVLTATVQPDDGLPTTHGLPGILRRLHDH